MSETSILTGSGHTPIAPAVALQLSAIDKSFPGVHALKSVDLEVRAGEIHALVGENGAGKSTLMAVASGALQPDSGAVIIGGTALAVASPARSRALGLAIVRQDPALLPDLTVAENLAVGVGVETVDGLANAVAWAREQLTPWQMGIDPRSTVAELSVEQRFVVEIVKALALRPSVLILDEPTEHLNSEEVGRLFGRVRECVATGTAVIYISHRIPEVKSIADRITVLRDGAVRGTFAASDVSEDEIVALVIGRSLDVVFPDKARNVQQTGGLVVTGLSSTGFHGIDVTVRPGEIVGLAGVSGNGQTEFLRALGGLVPARGSIVVNGRSVRTGSVRAARRCGVVYLPPDRHDEGVFLPLSVASNVNMGTLDEVATGGLLRRSAANTVAAEQVRRLAVRTPSVATPIRSLSGGNQQKVLLARSLLSKPAVLLAEEPTQGVDAGARVEIYRILREAADAGAAVLVLSSDGLELEGLCDRVLIMSRGAMVTELAGSQVTESAITGAALRSTTVRSRADRRSGRWDAIRRLGAGNQSPAVVLGLAVLALGILVTTQNPAYLTGRNFSGLLLLLSPLIFVSLAQLVVVMAGGFDLSVGPLCGFLVVIASFWLTDDAGVGSLLAGLGLVVLAAVGVGLINGVLVTRFNVNAVVATLAMFMALQGVSLLMRSRPGGIISEQVVAVVEFSLGPIPVALVAAVAAALALEWALRRTRWGIELRGTGSRPDAASRIGIPVRKVRLRSYVLCSLLVVPAGLMLMAQIGIGDGSAGIDYTLSSITAVVLGGASIFGGRGSFIGTLMGAVVIQQLVNVTTFLRLSQAWQYWLLALLTIGAAVVYAQLRRIGRTS